MRIMQVSLFVLTGIALSAASGTRTLFAEQTDVVASVEHRFADAGTKESPDFQRHVSPLLGRLGCNGRACHGSFQGRGGFRLSLFGYDFKMDHDALLDKESTRVDIEHPLDSLILNKPTDEDEHEGGKRYEKGSWQHHLLRNWVVGGAKFDAENVRPIAKLVIEPRELLFGKKDQKVRLKAIAVWPDGTREDVTPLCRFKSNDDVIAKIDEQGQVISGAPGDTHIVVFYDSAVVPIPALRPLTDKVANKYPSVPTPTEIDKLVVQKLKKLGVVPSEVSDDGEFLRRVSLDLTGTLPAAAEVEAFLKDDAPDKRKKKVEQLLNSPAYAAWWTTRLSDYTGNNADKLRNATAIRGRASEDWYQWIYKRVAENTPYDQLVEGIVVATSRRPNQSYLDYSKEMSRIYREESAKAYADLPSLPHYWARQDFTTPEERAIGFAYAFLGIRIQCAQCHKHPFDQWSKEDFAQFKQFFSVVSRGNTQSRDAETRKQYEAMVEKLKLKGMKGNQLRRELPRLLEEGKIVPFPEVHLVKASNKRRRGKPAESPVAKLLGEQEIKLADYEDPRMELMNWMRSESNPYFARAFVNRVWANYFNVGIVEPPDDLSLANPPSNRPLLDYLTRRFIENGYDMKSLHREIVNSRTYQLTWRPNETNQSDQRNFSHAIPRRLPAEVAYDAIRTATMNDERAAASRHELDGRAIAMASVGQRNANNGPAFALRVFGQSRRDSNCDCDRSADPTLLQTVFLQNDREMYSMLEQRKTGWLDDLAARMGTSLSSGTAKRRPANYEQQVRNLRKRIVQLKKQGDAQNLKVVKRRLRTLEQNFGAPRKSSGKQPQTAAAKKLISTKELVEQAYLRTLTRYPRVAELKKSVAYIDGADKKIDASRDLLWALLNTKEFIVNH